MKIIHLPMTIFAILIFGCGPDASAPDANVNPLTDHKSKILAIETGLRPTYGTPNEPVPTWTLEERMTHYDVPGVSIAVAIDGKFAWAKAYGTIEKGSDVAVDTETLFQAASLSKPVAAISALKLVDQGELSLDGPANQFLTSWKIPANGFTEKNEVTLRHFLSHRAGTTIHGFRGYEAIDPLPSLPQMLNGEPPANTEPVIVNKVPGESYRYSGGGYQIVQLMIEDVTGQSFANYVDSEIFDKVGLERSNFDYPQPDANAAVGHEGPSSTPIDEPGYVYPELAAAGLWTTPAELVSLGSEVSLARRTGDGIISQNLAQQLVPDTANAAGLGFGLNNAGDGVAFVHNGHNPGFSARWINYADGRASVAILTNSDSGGDLIREILSAVGYTYGWKQDGYVERETAELTDDWLASLSGGYAFDAVSTEPVAKISIEDGKLWLSGPFAERSRFYPASRTEFFIQKGMNFTIELDEEGQPLALDIEGEIRLPKMR